MTLRLDRLNAGRPIVDAQGRPTADFHRLWQKTIESIEDAVNNVATLLDTVIDLNNLITTAQAAADTAQAAADAAQTAADTAQTAATTANDAATAAASQTALQSSYPSGATINATDVGTSVTIAISAHNRVYPQADGSNVTVAVNGGSLTGLAYSTDYYIYYDDAARAGGAVTYQSTTSEVTGAQVGDRHAVGGVTTPAAAAPPATGKVTKPAGIVDLR